MLWECFGAGKKSTEKNNYSNSTDTMVKLPPVFKDGSLKDVAIHSCGALAVEDSGVPRSPSGASETILMVPGMGDFRQTYRFLAPLLHAAGHRVLLTDLRGQGESSAGFPSYTPEDVANDVAVILKFMGVGKPVVLIGNSLSGGSLLKVAAMNPALVKAVIGLAPVARDLPTDAWFRPLSYVLFAWPWGLSAWVSYFKSLFKSKLPEDISDYESAMRFSLNQTGRLWAVAEFGRGSKKTIAESAANVTCPVLFIFGEKDPDFANPLEEAHELARGLKSTRTVKYEIIAKVGHYPHVEEPVQVSEMIMNFFKDL